MTQKHFNLKNLLPKRPMPTIEMTRPYTSSVNVDILLNKIRQWEIYADKVESNKEGFEKELRELMRTLEKGASETNDPILKAWCNGGFQLIKEQILGEKELMKHV